MDNIISDISSTSIWQPKLSTMWKAFYSGDANGVQIAEEINLFPWSIMQTAGF